MENHAPMETFRRPASSAVEPMAIWSLALGVLACTPLLIFAGIPAIVCGHASLRLQARDPLLRGKPMAIAGLSLGYLSVLVAIVLGFWWFTKAHVGAAGPAQRDYAQRSLHEAEVVREATLMEGVAAIESGRRGCWPVDIGATTAEEFRKILLAGGRAGIETVDFGQFVVGNVAGGDPGDTIFLRSKVPTPGGFTVIVRKDGSGGIYLPHEPMGRVPPRDPAYLP